MDVDVELFKFKFLTRNTNKNKRLLMPVVMVVITLHVRVVFVNDLVNDINVFVNHFDPLVEDLGPTCTLTWGTTLANVLDVLNTDRDCRSGFSQPQDFVNDFVNGFVNTKVNNSTQSKNRK